MNNIQVSIIMPSLNVVDYIDECIKSAINQTLCDIEIIAIDAGSGDGTWEKLQGYAEHDSRIRLIRSNKKSYGFQVNLGIKEAKGKYIAILESDDYAELDMYENLYEAAERTGADYVKADFDKFYDKKEERVFNVIHLFNGDKESIYYNQLLDPGINPIIVACDTFVWKGLYNRNFLIDNAIFFSETNGAAYQDVGFAEMLHGCATKAYYIDKSLYRYRIDRAGASMNSGKGLMFDYYEFKRLFDNYEIISKIRCKEGLYWHMVRGFGGEIPKALKAVNYDYDSPDFKPYYEWFKNKMIEISNDLEFCSKIHFADIEKLVFNLDEYTQELKNADEFRKTYIDKALDGVVIFGAGRKGREAVELYKNNAIDVLAICDNDESKWGAEINGVEVMAPKECVEKYNGYAFCIANKKAYEEMERQLIDMKIDDRNIIIYKLN